MLAEGVLAFISTEYRGVAVSGNSLAIAGDECVMVVDSGHFPSMTRRQIAEVTKTFGKPIRFLVNTHWHPDHWMGNSIYRDEVPGVFVVTHEYTRTMMERKMADYPKQMKEQVPPMLTDLKVAVRNGTRKDGKPLTEDDTRYRTEVWIPDFEAFISQIDQMVVFFPTVCFRQGLTLDLGSRVVEISHLGRGNTGGDAVVHVPDAGIVATGDLVVAPIPFSFGSFIREWAGTLRRLRETRAGILVPGHGQVMRDWTYVETLGGMLESVSQQVREELRKTLPPGAKPPTVEEVQAKVNVKSYQEKLAGDSYFLNLAFERTFLQPAVERAYLEERFSLE